MENFSPLFGPILALVFTEKLFQTFSILKPPSTAKYPKTESFV